MAHLLTPGDKTDQSFGAQFFRYEYAAAEYGFAVLIMSINFIIQHVQNMLLSFILFLF